MPPTASFRVARRDGRSRTGTLETSHGILETPFFMPVGTLGSVKALTVEELRRLEPGIVLCNTYHLMLRPGIELIEKMGGIHGFMGWDDVVLSDSGGFQVYSLAAIRKVRDEGVEFQSHIDGSTHTLTPEKSVGIQDRMGVDIAMAFDECPAGDLERDELRRSMDRTHRWAERSLAVPRNQSALFGIVQGGTDMDLRRESAQAICSMPFDGFAIGGLSVGEPKEAMLETIDGTAALLPEDRPRYLMGVGTPGDILDSVRAGIDMFDCVMPTRNARNGTLFSSRGKISIRNARYRDDNQPVDPDCGCLTCTTVSRAYLRHLYVSGEIAALVYNTIHNLRFYLDLMKGIRQAVASRSFEEYCAAFLSRTAESS